MADGFFELWFASRYVHVAAIALVAGGAMLACLVCMWPAASGHAAAAVAVVYEWTFWTAAGLVALTGISNLGLKGDGLLDARTTWGAALTTKFALVLTMLALSFVRTEVVRRWHGSARDAPPTARALAVLYAGTAATILSIAWIGLGLAHGRY